MIGFLLKLLRARSARKGLAATPAHLKIVRKNILNMPIRQQATYADMVVRNNANNPAWLQNQLQAMELNLPLYKKSVNWNTTSIGNLAFLSLYAALPWRDDFKSLYDEILPALRK